MGAGSLGALSARAQSSPLGTVVEASLVTTSGRTRSLSQLRGKTVVLFYETRGAINVNQHVKDAMGRRFNADRALANRFALVAACNVAEYNTWPSRYFAGQAIATVANSNHLELWLDWDRTMITRLGMHDNASNIALIDRNGRFHHHQWGRVANNAVDPLLDRMVALANA